ncbi:LysR substrate-binding domain-containing protein [Novosphingobium sp. 1949]|uniref:LysR substrate-binding domain-containing protein n=1 Tax=Novosphingobium organovorum TaxID=2930092 RepID=A0ABT0BDC8_9SPHN|nr:LysR substrate-binding domain-containing protein [Novosphingobium organovorum]MCJ2182910.1 LysR substrate-binding domain-containing protein [Novosphingobium organovorum]
MNEDDRRSLPPMAMLHSFETAARTGSFTAAASALRLTQGAVSRNIAALEDWLGASLFERSGRRVRLNETGQRYREAIAPALAAIRRATTQLLDPGPEHALELAVLPSFGMRWLAPRLPRLSQAHPDLVVNITARSDLFDFAHEAFDAAIHVGAADWPGAAHDRLFREQVVPVVAPAVRERFAIAQPADLLRVPLLAQSRRKDAWTRWFAQSGLDAPQGMAVQTLSHFLMLAQAVKAGAGAALLPSFLIGPELAAGELVVPVAIALTEERSYWLAYPESGARSPALDRFRDWLQRESAADRGTDAISG